MATTINVKFDEDKLKQYIADKAAKILQDYYDGKTFTISGGGLWWKDQYSNPPVGRYSGSQVLQYAATASADANGTITVTIKPTLIIQVTQIQ